MRIRPEGLTWQEIDGELVILDLQNSTYLTTNAAGAILAKELTEERSLPELAARLVAEFGIDAATAERDAAAFVAQLEAKRLLADPPAAD
ncbi:PqqD family protein [Propionicicella superfundia]|uniref:PqqD family protein n=1 Tax=Propionicicella superfundia TaxID=348582 RepID=UPI0004908D24|nr:PqqD family protein [Propionicicella superfundia]